MRLILFVALLLAAVLTAGSPQTAGAKTPDLPTSPLPPDRLEHFRILPRFSTLTQTGGFAGFERDFRLQGEYDFIRQFLNVLRVNEQGSVSSRLEQVARFENVNIQAPLGELLPAFIDVGDLLNLEGLWGSPAPSASLFEVFRFEGEIADGSSIELFTAQVGPWMLLSGSTTPPPGGADFFEYEISALARRGAWADLNGDGVVDSADYTRWRDGSGAAAGVTYADWRSQFGERAPDLDAFSAAVASASTSLAVVPEPATLPLLLTAAAWLGGRRRQT